MTRIECEDRATARRVLTRLQNGKIKAFTAHGVQEFHVYADADRATCFEELPRYLTLGLIFSHIESSGAQ